MLRSAVKKAGKGGISVGMKIASFAKREIEREAVKAMKSPKARALALKLASKMKAEAIKTERMLRAEISKEIKAKRYSKKKKR